MYKTTLGLHIAIKITLFLKAYISDANPFKFLASKCKARPQT